jgi:heptosyltransferase-2
MNKIQIISADIAKIAKDRLLSDAISFSQGDWKDGLAIRTPNWLGDAVMALPAMKLLKSIVPKNCAIFAVTIPALRDFFRSVDCVDKVICLSSAHKAWSREDAIKVRQTHSGAALLLNNSLRDAFFFRLAMPFRRIYGASARGRGIFLSKSFLFDSEGLMSKEHHHASIYLSMAYAFGAEEWDGTFPIFNEIKEPEIMPAELVKLLKNKNMLVVAPGAAYGAAKKWPVANFAKVCDWWIKEKKGVAVAVGASSEIASASELEKLVSSPDFANFAGKTDIMDLIAILKKAVFCVSNDSGVMHLSAAAGGAGIAIFGSTNPFATGPLSGRWKIIYSGEECSPCLKRECEDGHYRCLEGIDAETVIKAIKDSLEFT